MDTSLDKSDGELSDGELPSDEGEVSDEGELPESEGEVEMSTEVPDKPPKEVGDKFDRYKIWQEAIVNNMRSAMTKVTDANPYSSEESGSEEENSAFMMNDSEIPPNLRGYNDRGDDLLGALGVDQDQDQEAEGAGVKRKKKKKKKSTPSEWWERHKELYDQMKEKRQEMESYRAKTPCRFFLKGYCKEGNECSFLHEMIKKLDVCKYFMKNLPCHKGEFCPYMHNEYPCKYFHLRGFCYNDHECRFSHEALTDDTRQIIEFLKDDRYDNRGPRFKRFRSRSRSRSRSPIDRGEKPLFTDPDNESPANKKVLLPTPENEKEEEESRQKERSTDRHSDRHSDRNGRHSSSRYDDRPYNRHDNHHHGYRGGRGGFFRGRGRGSPRGGGFRGNYRGGGGFRRGGYHDNRRSPNYNNNNNQHHGGPGGFQQGPGGPGFNSAPPQQQDMFTGPFPPPEQQPLPLPEQQQGAPISATPFQQADFVPLNHPQNYQRPPPPPPPPPQPQLSDFGGNQSADQVPEPASVVCAARYQVPEPASVVCAARYQVPEPASVVCAARDPRLKQHSEKAVVVATPVPEIKQPVPVVASAEPTLADMFKSLDPTASPFG